MRSVQLFETAICAGFDKFIGNILFDQQNYVGIYIYMYIDISYKTARHTKFEQQW